MTVVSCVPASLLPLPFADEPALHLREQLGSFAPGTELIEIQVTVTYTLDLACQPRQLGDMALTRTLLVAPGPGHETRLQRLCDKRRESIAAAKLSSVTFDMGRSPWYLRKGHGTEARAKRHYREGEKPCDACRQAMNEARNLRGWKPRKR